MLNFINLFKKDKTMSANHFLKIREILDELYTFNDDNDILGYLKVYTKNCNLMSKEEKLAHAVTLTSNLSTELKPFKIFYLNRPVDLQKNQDFQAMLMENETNSIKFSLQDKRSKSFGVLSTTRKSFRR